MTAVTGGVTIGGTHYPASAQVTLPGAASYSCTRTWPSDNGQCGPYPGYKGITGLAPSASPPTVGQNVWTQSQADHQHLFANSPGDWYVTVNATTNFGGVQAFPNTGWGMAWPEVPVDSYHSLLSSWDVTIPQDATKVAGWACYDLWFNNWADEVMIQVDITAPSQYQVTPNVASATFGGQPWHMLPLFGRERVWKPGTDDLHLRSAASGSLDIQPILTWMEASGQLPKGSTWTAGSFGFEVCDTHGTDQAFRVNAFEFHVA